MSTLAKEKALKVDPIYGNAAVTQLINRVMKNGKKLTASKLVYDALDNIKKTGEDPINVFQKAINNVSPKVEVKARRVGGASYQVPTEVSGNRRVTLAIRWIINSARKKSNKDFHTFSEKLSTELLDASKNQGEAIKKKESTQKMAEANKVFSHFRW